MDWMDAFRMVEQIYNKGIKLDKNMANGKRPLFCVFFNV